MGGGDVNLLRSSYPNHLALAHQDSTTVLLALMLTSKIDLSFPQLHLPFLAAGQRSLRKAPELTTTAWFCGDGPSPRTRTGFIAAAVLSASFSFFTRLPIAKQEQFPLPWCLCMCVGSSLAPGSSLLSGETSHVHACVFLSSCFAVLVRTKSCRGRRDASAAVFGVYVHVVFYEPSD